MKINGGSAGEFLTGSSDSDIDLLKMLEMTSYYIIRKENLLNLFNILLKIKIKYKEKVLVLLKVTLIQVRIRAVVLNTDVLLHSKKREIDKSIQYARDQEMK